MATIALYAGKINNMPSQTQEQRIEILENFQENSEDFIQDTVRIDNNVADTVDQNKDDF